MKDMILKIAVLYPHKFPWENRLNKGGINISETELQNLLESEKIGTEFERRKLGWIIEKLVYSNAKKICDVNKLKNVISTEYSKLGLNIKFITDSLIHSCLSRKDMDDEQKIKMYQKILRGNFEDYNQDKNKNIINNWLFELLMYYFISKPENKELSRESVENFVFDSIENILDYNHDREPIIKRQAQLGFTYKKNIMQLKSVYSESYDIFKGLLTNILKDDEIDGKKEKNDDHIIYDLMGMINENETETNKVEKEEGEIDREISKDDVCSEKNEKVIDTNEEKLKKKDKKSGEILDKTLGEIIEEAGYKLAKEDEESSENSVLSNFFKKLVDPMEGAVLSQLYEVFSNINNTDISNVQAALGDFFNYLMVNGIHPITDEVKLGEKIRVNSSELLKKYRSMTPVEEGDFRAVVKYPAWEYDEKILMQTIIKPIK